MFGLQYFKNCKMHHVIVDHFKIIEYIREWGRYETNFSNLKIYTSRLTVIFFPLFYGLEIFITKVEAVTEE